jgi:hypothetical protein
MAGLFDALQFTEAVQDAVRRGDREHLGRVVSDDMIWVMPVTGNQRGKHEWIEASCSVTWHWFEVTVLRALELDNVRVVESWIRQSRHPTPSEGASGPVVGAGVVLDVWVNESGAWLLVARHPQRASDETARGE